jgi:hypothetical protein
MVIDSSIVASAFNGRAQWSVVIVEFKQYSVRIEEENLLQVGCGDFIKTVCNSERLQSRDSRIMTRTIKGYMVNGAGVITILGDRCE